MTQIWYDRFYQYTLNAFAKPNLSQKRYYVWFNSITDKIIKN